MTPDEHARAAFALCVCGHERARHCGCDKHDECCDEDDCACVAFVAAEAP